MWANSKFTEIACQQHKLQEVQREGCDARLPSLLNLDARLSFILPANLLSHSAWLGSDRIGCDCDHCSLPTFLAVPTAAEYRTSQVVRQSNLQRSFTLSANKIRSIRRDSTGHLQRLLEPYSTIVVRCAVTTLPSDSNTHAQNNECSFLRP